MKLCDHWCFSVYAYLLLYTVITHIPSYCIYEGFADAVRNMYVLLTNKANFLVQKLFDLLVCSLQRDTLFALWRVAHNSCIHMY